MKILLIDDHALFREGLKALLPRLDDTLQLIEASSCGGGLDVLREQGDLNLALLDLGLGDGNDRLCCLRRLRSADPTLPIVIISAHESAATVKAALREGASGYILKSSPTAVVFEALRQVLAGGVYFPPSLTTDDGEMPDNPFTQRQRQVLELMARGEPNKTIARHLGTAEGTVRIHVTAIIKALGAANRTEAVTKAIRLGYVADFSES
ncbi:LuxR C-terminal-related transcriptional regulator [Gilvimarinus sp. F26214L]|uniref:LuxR C-terminal-related transcriptional regulator n=1 Tax=Gilvimarinus sp. DZF01 TaxID=3461371 RepID=UPI004045614C